MEEEINNSDLAPKIQDRITNSNQLFHSLKKYMKSSFFRQITKILLYKTLISSVLARGLDTWVFNVRWRPCEYPKKKTYRAFSIELRLAALGEKNSF